MLGFPVSDDKQHDSNPESQRNVTSQSNANQLVASPWCAGWKILRLTQAHPTCSEQSAMPIMGTVLGVPGACCILSDPALRSYC